MSTLNKIKAEKVMTDVYHGNVSLAQIPKLREGFEEIGIRKDDVTSISLLGITRELVRGGEPEMFFSALTELSEKQVRKSWKRAKDKWESKKLIFHNFRLSKLDENNQKHDFLCQVDNFLARRFKYASIPLLTAIALWVKQRLQEEAYGHFLVNLEESLRLIILDSVFLKLSITLHSARVTTTLWNLFLNQVFL